MMNSRRDFIKKSTLTLTGLSVLGMVPAIQNANVASKKQNSILRVMAYNILEASGWPQDNPFAQKAKLKKQMAPRLALELSLYDPDIIAFAECPDEDIIEDIAKNMGMNYVYFPSGGYWPGTIMTPHEIVDSQNTPILNGTRPEDLFTRHWGRARIRLHNQSEVIVHTIHLFPQNNPEGRAIRKREISEILKSMQADVDNNESMLILADLNHAPFTPEYDMWMDFGWADTFAEAGQGDGNTFRVDEPRTRIDYVMAHGPLKEKIRKSKPLFEGAFRTNPDDPESFALSDHLPVYTEFDLD